MAIHWGLMDSTRILGDTLNKILVKVGQDWSTLSGGYYTIINPHESP